MIATDWLKERRLVAEAGRLVAKWAKGVMPARRQEVTMCTPN